MDITPLIDVRSQVIQSYGADGFKISGEPYDSPIAVFPDRVVVWTPGDLDRASDFAPVLEGAGELDVVLFGGGAQAVFMKPLLRDELRAAGLIIETMDTGAACRTYNLLMTEGRRVAALLLPV